MNIEFLVVAIFFALYVYVGWYYRKSFKSSDDLGFFEGIKPMVLAASMFACALQKKGLFQLFRRRLTSSGHHVYIIHSDPCGSKLL
jgi:hypothetical protein